MKLLPLFSFDLLGGSFVTGVLIRGRASAAIRPLLKLVTSGQLLTGRLSPDAWVEREHAGSTTGRANPKAKKFSLLFLSFLVRSFRSNERLPSLRPVSKSLAPKSHVISHISGFS